MAQRLNSNPVTMFKYALLFLISIGFAVKGHASKACASTFADSQVWLDANGIKEEMLFKTSSAQEAPLSMRITVEDWTTVHKAPDRAQAKSPATFEVQGFKFDGEIQARGQSRFNLFSQRALRFEIGEEDYRLVTHFGSLKGKRRTSRALQDARVLVEYTAYKIYEILSPKKSVQTRLAQIQFKNAEGKILDEGYAFFVEGEKAVGKKLGLEPSGTSYDFIPDSPGSFLGEMFRQFILDQDIGNMPNNYFYFGSSQRIPYDFDMSALAPPLAMKTDAITGAGEYFKKWLQDNYELGSENMQYDLSLIQSEKSPARRQQLQQKYDLQLAQRQVEIKQALKTFLDNEAQLARLFDDPRMAAPYRQTQALWYRTAFNVIKTHYFFLHKISGVQ